MWHMCAPYERMSARVRPLTRSVGDDFEEVAE